MRSTATPGPERIEKRLCTVT